MTETIARLADETSAATYGQFIDGQWTAGAGPSLRAINPATNHAYWQGRAANTDEARQACVVAYRQAAEWGHTPVRDRLGVIERFAETLEAHRDSLSHIISIETGKPRWEAQAEVGAMIRKVPITVEAMRSRRPMEGAFNLTEDNEATRYKPLGALAVLGPFNLPGHLPNGHIVPALLAGNTVVFKPSDHTPWTGAFMAALWEEAGLPAGVFNVVQGGGDIGAAIVNDPNHNGVLFTGGLKAGLAIRRALVDQPQRILALEMGGNNPLVVHNVSDVQAAALATIQSAFVTAGQRCTCARRLIISNDKAGDHFLNMLLSMIDTIRIGAPDDEPPPFMGPMIDGNAADAMLDSIKQLQADGGRVLRQPKRLEPTRAFLTPGLIDTTEVQARTDEELFGPLLQVIRVNDFEAAIEEATRTAFGLVAGLLSDDPSLYEQFHQHVRAGLINWNKPTTGASSRLPFGGVGKSGNFRPSGAFAIDYCTYPVASLEDNVLAMPSTLPHGIAPSQSKP